LTLLFESSVKIWIVRGLCQIMKVFSSHKTKQISS
jgi:hypothetical protein